MIPPLAVELLDSARKVAVREVGVVASVAHQPLWNKVHRGMQSELDGEVNVLCPLSEGLVPAGRCLVRTATDEGRRRQRAEACDKRRQRRFCLIGCKRAQAVGRRRIAHVPRLGKLGNVQVLVEVIDWSQRTVGQADVLVRIEVREHRLDGVGLEHIVGVEKEQVLASARADRETVVASVAHVPIGLTDRVDAPIPRRVAGNDRCRVVGAAVVDDDVLPVREGLRLHAFDRATDEARAVVTGGDDAESCHAPE